MLRDEAISAGATSTKPRTAEIPSSLYRRTGLLLRNPSEKGPFRRFLRKADFGRGRSGAGRRGGSQATGASGASRISPSCRPFAPAEPSKEAHDSSVLVLQCRRTRRPRCREPTPVLGPAGHLYQALSGPRSLRGPRPGFALGS